MKRIKVLHVIESLENRGAERQLLLLSTGLLKLDYDVQVCSLRPGGILVHELQRSGVPVTEFHKQGKMDFFTLAQLVDFMRRQRFQIVHTHVFTANLWGRLAAWLARVPVIVTHEHGSFTLGSSLRKTVNRVLENVTDLSFVVTKELVERFSQENHLPAQKLSLLHNGLDFSRLNGQVSDLQSRFSSHYPVIGTVGELEPRKDHRSFIYAARLLLKKYADAQFLLIGDGEERASLERTAHSLKLTKHIHFIGQRQDVFAILKLMHVFVLPSRTEGTSIALLEALAAGVPVVATSVGGNPEVLQWGRFGYLAPSTNPIALAEAIDDLLQDAKRMQAYSALAKTYVFQNYNIDQSVAALDKIYRQLLRQKGRFSDRKVPV